MMTSISPQVLGLIDGSVDVSRSPDGGVSFRIVVGTGEMSSEECDHIEFILGADTADALRRALRDLASGRRREPVAPLPCAVGLRRQNH